VAVRDGSIRRNVRTIEGQFRSDNSPPIVTLDTKQPTGVQGTTMLVQVRTNEPADLLLDLGPKGQIKLAPEGKAYVALVGFDPSTAAGDIPGNIVARDEAGNESSSPMKITVTRGNFYSETIDLNAEMLGWLTSGLYDTELQNLGEFFNPSGTPRLWDGMFDAPAKGPIASGYGIDRTYNGGQAKNRHLGTDFDVPTGTPVAAAAKGTVVFADKLVVRGNAVIVDHGVGIHTAYYHMSRLDIKPGTMVNKGQQLGLSGDTGLATAPHLHWEVRIAGTAVEPLDWLKKKML
jgi:murein DD-endopeptidase MepM/ murein hydrolase activator NlpD